MNMRKVVLGLVVVLALALTAYAVGAAGLIGAGAEAAGSSMPVPGAEDVPEMIVDSGMPVPGEEGVEEMVVDSPMPVPGLAGVDEMIVGDR